MRRVGLGLLVVALVAACASTGDGGGAAPGGPTPTTAAAPAPPSSTRPPASPTNGGRGDRAPVVGVTDGDTLTVELAGREEDVRLIGINTPESGECFAAEATAALTDLVAGREVRLVRDESDRDQFDRLLRYVFVGDTFVNRRLVEDGFALAYRYEPDVARADELDAAQASAEAAGRGLWAPDACGRVDSDAGSVVIGELVADPPGDDTLDANAEYVVIRNAGPDEVDLTGWGVKDETASHRFSFPVGFTLPAGGSVTVHTGCGTPSATDLFWCNEGSAIWNNDGDTAFLLDPDGNIVDTRAY